MTRKQRITAAVVVVLTCYFLVLPGLWTWLPPSATAVVPSSWPHNKDMPIEIRLSAWHSNYELREVRFGILPERGQVQLQRPPLYPLVLIEGRHNRTWNRLTLNRFTYPRTRRIMVVVPLERLAAEGIAYEAVNFGSFMFDVARKEDLAADRDEMRKLGKDVQKRLQQAAASEIAAMSADANIIVDTHSSVKTPAGFLAGLPEWVLKELMPDIVVLVETDPDQILMRRLGDASRTRDMEGARAIAEHQEFNRAVSAAYAMYTGCTVKVVRNENYLLERGIDDLADVLR